MIFRKSIFHPAFHPEILNYLYPIMLTSMAKNSAVMAILLVLFVSEPSFGIA
jgi:hypothetical protein